MTLETQVTGGRTTWMDRLAHDPTQARIELRTVDPNAPELPLCRVVFTGVTNLAEEPFDPGVPYDPSLLEGLIGLDVQVRGSATWYVIHTDQRELSFYAEKEPEVMVLDARG